VITTTPLTSQVCQVYNLVEIENQYYSSGEGVFPMYFDIIPGWFYGAVIVGFITLFSTFVFDLTALAEKKCPICKKSFNDVFGLNQHIKMVERAALKKAA